MAEISSLVRRYNVAAQVTLASPSHIEYLYELAPSWSCVFLQPVEGGRMMIRFRARQADFPDRETQIRCLRDSVGMLMGIRAMALRVSDQMDALISEVSSEMDIMHVEREES